MRTGTDVEDLGRAQPERGHPLRWWDIGVGATLAAMAGVGLVELLEGGGAGGSAPPLGAAIRTLGVLALVLAWYLALGRAAVRRATLDSPTRAVDYAYLAGLVLLIGLAAAVVPSYATLQAIAYPMVWTIVARYRDAVLWSAALALAVGVGFVVGVSPSGRMEGLGEAAAIGLLSFAFAVAMGTWITRIFAQGERYRVLAEQLRRSQAEVAELSAAAGAAAERERLSRELHDTLTQTLTGLVMLGEQADRALAAGRVDRARDRLARVQAASRAAVEEARALVATTQPLGDGGLEQAIERVAASLREDSGMRVRCEIEHLPLDREQQVVLLRATQEGLANARRHARAGEAVIVLRRDPRGKSGGEPDSGYDGEGGDARDDALLTVEDDGIGPASAASSTDRAPAGRRSSSGFGLSGLRDRVRLAGGEARFGPREGGGSRLEVRLPLIAGEDSGHGGERGVTA